MEEKVQQLSAKLYEQVQQEAQEAQGAENAEGQQGDDVVDADYTEVDDDDKENK